MIFPGTTSATTRALSIEETIEAALQGGLKGIEWEAQKHVRPGDVQTADKAREFCAEAGLKIPSYGAYYAAGFSEQEGMRFSTVLATAKALGAPMIRIWAGRQDYDKSDEAYIKNVANDTLRIADMAAAANINLVASCPDDHPKCPAKEKKRILFRPPVLFVL